MLFRFERRVATWCAGGRNDRHAVAGSRRRPLHFGIDASRRLNDTARATQLRAAGSACRRRGRRARLLRPLIFSCHGGRCKTRKCQDEKPHPVHRRLHACHHTGQTRLCAAYPQRILVARRAPSAIASNLAQQIDGWPTRVPSPQSVPASTFSRPTNRA